MKYVNVKTLEELRVRKDVLQGIFSHSLKIGHVWIATGYIRQALRQENYWRRGGYGCATLEVCPRSASCIEKLVLYFRTFAIVNGPESCTQSDYESRRVNQGKNFASARLKYIYLSLTLDICAIALFPFFRSS